MGIPDNELHPAYCVGLLAMHGASLLGGQPSVRRTIITGERLLKRTLRESNKSARCVALCRWREWAHVDRFRRCLQKARCFLARESSCWMAGCVFEYTLPDFSRRTSLFCHPNASAVSVAAKTIGQSNAEDPFQTQARH